MVSNPLVSGCGGNRDTKLFVRQAYVLKILGFDDGGYVTPSETFKRNSLGFKEKLVSLLNVLNERLLPTLETGFMLETK